VFCQRLGLVFESQTTCEPPPRIDPTTMGNEPCQSPHEEILRSLGQPRTHVDSAMAIVVEGEVQPLLV
jgi:hypothetical protein